MTTSGEGNYTLVLDPALQEQNREKAREMQSVPVVDRNNKPLMPTTSSRARRFIKSGKATPFWKGFLFCIRLNVQPSDNKIQDICLGIDPGSKREGFTLKSKSKTYLNIQSNAVDWVKKALKTRREMRRGRRYRNTPYRKCRSNRKRNEGWLAPSTKARWQVKLRIVNVLRKAYPITHFAVEDVKATTKPGARRWNTSFSPLETGKNWFYSELRKLGEVRTYLGQETYSLRESLGLVKSKKKLSDEFEAHCVDSWALANDVVGGHLLPDDKRLLKVCPLRCHRRQLHRLQFSKGGVRSHYGGTMSLGLKRGSVVVHEKKYGKCYIGGSSKNRVSLHSLGSGKRLTQGVKVGELRFRSYNSWSWQLLPGINAGVRCYRQEESELDEVEIRIVSAVGNSFRVAE